MVRTRLLFLALMVVAVGVASVLVSLRTILHTEATTIGAGTMQFRASGTGVTGTGCDGVGNPTECTVPLSGPFQLKVAVIDFPTGGYIAAAYDLDFTGTGLTKTPPNCTASASEIVWPDKAGLNSCDAPSATHYQGGDLSTGFGATPSLFKGNVFVFNMNCTSGNSTATIQLVPLDLATNPLGAVITGVGSNSIPISDTLTINCGTGGVSTLRSMPRRCSKRSNSRRAGSICDP